MSISAGRPYIQVALEPGTPTWQAVVELLRGPLTAAHAKKLLGFEPNWRQCVITFAAISHGETIRNGQLSIKSGENSVTLNVSVTNGRPTGVFTYGLVPTPIPAHLSSRLAGYLNLSALAAGTVTDAQVKAATAAAVARTGVAGQAKPLLPARPPTGPPSGHRPSR